MRRTLCARIGLPALLVAALIGGITSAAAQDEPSPATSAGDLRLAGQLKQDLGAASPGAYLDADGGLVVTVTTDAAAEKAEAAGAKAERVQRSAAQLKTAMDTLSAKAAIPGTTWGVNPRTNQVAATYDSTVSKRELARLKKVAAGLDGAVKLSRAPGKLTREVNGGDAIYGGGYRCSAAFNVAKGTARYFLTAGHCTESGATWSATSGGATIGTREGTSFPTNDYGLVKYASTSGTPGTVNLYNGSSQDITGSANAVVGQSLKKSGSTTKVTSGKVEAVNVTANYGGGDIVSGLVRTTACSAGGDSGGAHFAGATALGIHSGSSGCSGTAGTALHQPVKEALSAYGVNVY
ncbi:S1 family peptidase [Streptomyces sp. A7024]|uniref:S1 family peptidase n=1 Tax=Streptomyces coryli TaxID=1128680 RepID=A0A6G4U300_9ACTN|nr:S1 family peptidase [Streptomyces coryli]NGN66086.1 S1 family peptidase [Streptomyces coryli]